MKITPLEIQRKHFPVTLRGFERESVSSFLELITSQMEDLVRENTELKEACILKDRELEQHRKVEPALNNTLVNTRKMLNEYRVTTQAEIRNLKQKAEADASRTIADAHDKAAKIHADISDLNKYKKQLQIQLKLIIDNHLNMLALLNDNDPDERPATKNRRSDGVTRNPCFTVPDLPVLICHSQ